MREKEREKINLFVKEASDIGLDIFNQKTRVNHQNLTLALVSTFLERCNSKEEIDLLRTTIGLVIKDSVEYDMKNEILKEASEDFAYERAKENGDIQ